MFFPKTEHVFPNKFFQKRRFFLENGASQSRWLVSPKSVTDFPKVGDRFSQSRWRISPKSVTDFLKIGGRFPQTRGQISLKSVTDFPKSVTDFPEIGAKSVTGFPTEPSMFSIWFYKLFIFPPVSSFLFKPLQMKEFLRGQLQTLDINVHCFSGTLAQETLEVASLLNLILVEELSVHTISGTCTEMCKDAHRFCMVNLHCSLGKTGQLFKNRRDICMICCHLMNFSKLFEYF